MQTSLPSNQTNETSVTEVETSDSVASTLTTREFIGQIRNKVLTTGKPISVYLEIGADLSEKFFVVNDRGVIINALQPTRYELERGERMRSQEPLKHKENKIILRFKGWSIFVTSLLDWVKQNLTGLPK